MKLPLCTALFLATAPAAAQTAVPLTSEPHHHLVYTSDRLRVYRVEVPVNSSTLLHEHGVDYFWIAVGAAESINDIPGKPAAKVVAADGSVHFTRGGFSHVARIEGARAFHNVSLELPQAQTNPRNLCEAVLAAEQTYCPSAMMRAAAAYTGDGVRPEFETDQVRVTLLTIAPSATIRIGKFDRPPVIVAVDPADRTTQMTCRDASGSKTVALRAKSGETYSLAASTPCSLHNSAAAPARFLAVEFTGTPR